MSGERAERKYNVSGIGFERENYHKKLVDERDMGIIGINETAVIFAVYSVGFHLDLSLVCLSLSPFFVVFLVSY
jgi:hypothetical protein